MDVAIMVYVEMITTDIGEEGKGEEERKSWI